MQTVVLNGRRFPRFMVGQSRGYCVYDNVAKTFGPRLANKRVALLECRRLNSGAVS